MTIATENATGSCVGPAPVAGQPGGPAGSGRYDEPVAALTAAYYRTVDHIMTTRYGPGWATRGDLPDDAYTAETVFDRWLSDLLDHIDTAATAPSPTNGGDRLPDHVISFNAPVPV